MNHPGAVARERENLVIELFLLTFRDLVPRGSTVLAKSVTPERIKENMTLIKLDDEDVKLLDDYSDKLTKEGKLQRFVYPPFGIDFGFPDKS
jgi:diketogulonate reductase-like aldo/keto reductase